MNDVENFTAEAHQKIADQFAKEGEPIRAYAALRSAIALGASEPELAEKLNELATSAFELSHDSMKGASFEELRRTRLARISTLSRLERIAGLLRSSLPSGGSVLDVGGGRGLLAPLLADYRYCIADPKLNEVALGKGVSLGRKFDAVVCCHVVEHIPESEKNDFLDALWEHAESELILIGPIDRFDHSNEVPKFLYDMTGSEWAREHAECGKPTVSFFEEFALSRSLDCSVEYTGNSPAQYWMVLARHFARQGGAQKQFRKALEFYNAEMGGDGNAPDRAGEGAVILRKKEG